MLKSNPTFDYEGYILIQDVDKLGTTAVVQVGR